MEYKILLWIAIAALPACQHRPRYKDDFYNNDMSDISQRLPLVKPYELIRDPTRGKKEDLWEIGFRHEIKFPVAADTIYVDRDRCILGYGSNGTMVIRGDTSAYMIYFIVDLPTGHERLFYDRTGFGNELKKYGVGWSDLVPTDRLYSRYHDTGILPWQ